MAGRSNGAASVRGLMAAALGVAIAVAVGPAPASMDAGARVPLREKFPQLPLSFEANRGQTDRAVSFIARGAASTMWLAGTDAVLAFASPRDGGTDVLRMSFVGAREPVLAGRDELATKSNYFRSGAEGIRNVPHFGEVVGTDLYPGVDLRWHGDQGALEYDVTFAPHADPSLVRMEMKGADALAVRENGDLAIRVGSREIVQTAPIAWQMNGAAREPVAAAFEVRGDEVSFRLGAYDPSRAVVVDPSITFSTYLGGSGDETANGVAVDPVSQAIVVCGATTSLDYPPGFGHLPTFFHGSTDAYVAKLNAAGSAVLWSTYLGGADYDEAFGVAIDPTSHNVWIVGQTYSSNYPTMVPTQALRAGQWDAFATEIDENGNFLLFSTYLGGPLDDFARAVTIGSRVHVTGYTESSVGFPIVAPVQVGYGGGPNDAFVTSWSRTTPQGGILVSTFLGGTGDDRGYDIATIAGIAAAAQPGTVELVANRSFETGTFSSWGTTDVGGPPDYPLAVQPAGFPGHFFLNAPTDGGFSAFTGFGQGSTAGTISIFQDVLVPPTSDLGVVTFDFRAGWEILGTAPRTFDVQILPSGGGAPLQSQNFLTTTFGPNPATVVDFDDIVPLFVPLPPGYGGINWDAEWYSYLHNPPVYPAHSNGRSVGANGATLGVGEATFTFNRPVVFDGAWLAGIGLANEWRLYFQGVPVFTSASQNATTTQTFFPTGYGGRVDEVRFFGDRNLIVLDDFQYHTIGTPDTGPLSGSMDVDLTPFAGSGARLRFLLTVPETDTGPAQFQLDNVHFWAAKGGVLVGGRTGSANFPRLNTFNLSSQTFQGNYGGGLADGFVTEYRRNVNAINWSTTWGGRGDDETRGVAIAPGGDVAFTGNTNSTTMPRVLAFQPTRRGPDDAFVVKSPNGASGVDFATYLGGSDSDAGNAISINATTGDVYVAGTTSSLNFPVTGDALQGSLNGGQNTDAFVARFGTVVNPGFPKYISYFGGTGLDSGRDMVLQSGSTLVLTGTTRSVVGFPVALPFQGALGGTSDGFLAKLDVASIPFPAAELVAEPRSPVSVALSWNEIPEGAAGLAIERTSADGTKTEVATLPSTATEFVDTGLAPDTAYTYEVAVVHADGAHDVPGLAQTVTPPYPPAAPAGLVASADGAKVVLDWIDVSDNETNYEIQRARGGAFATVATLKAGRTHFETPVATPGEQESVWRVVAVNRGGTGASGSAAVTTTANLSIDVRAGSLVDSAKAYSDRFTARGRIAGSQAFDPMAQAMRIELGTADRPVVLVVPAGDRGWRVRRGVFSWTAPRGRGAGPRLEFQFNPSKGTFALTVTKFDFPAAPSNPVFVGLTLGDEAGAAQAEWTNKKTGRFAKK